MKRFVFFLMILLVLAAPAWAQESTPEREASDPAAYVPVNTPVYFELDTSTEGQQAFDAAAKLYLGMLGVPTSFIEDQVTLDLVVANRLPSVSWLDIQSWVGSHAALVLNEGVTPGLSDFAFVLPIADEAGAAAFVTQLQERTFDHERYGSVNLYYAGIYTVAVGSSMIWLGSPAGVDALFRAPPENLAQSASYQRVRAQLPDAPITGYVDGAWLQTEFTNIGAGGNPSLATLASTFLQLHPIESAFKTALLNGAAIDGFGIAVQADDNQLTTDLAFALDANTTTPNSPLTLGAYAPPDSFVVLDSYDVTIFAASVGGAARLLLPQQNVGLPASAELSAPTPSPTPDMIPVQTLIAQVQPIITQAESLAGLSLADLYDLIDGEYLFAAFPTESGSTGAALWVRSSFPLRVITALETASKLVLTDPDGTQLINVERTTVSGVTVALITLPNSSERLAIGAFDNLLFVTNESLVQQVIDAAANSDAERAWVSSFDGQQDATFYIDVQSLDRVMLSQQRNTPLPLTAISGVLSISDDGVFTLHLEGTSGE